MLEKNLKTTVIKFKVSSLENDYIKAMADSYGYKNISEFIRTRLITPQQGNHRMQLKMIYEINKIGHNINQLTRTANADKSIKKEVLEELQMMNVLLMEVLQEFKKC